jgi:nicotinamidase-related amidase
MSDAYTAPEFHAAALVTIDVQHDFLDGGPMEIAGTTQALPAMATLARAFRRAGRPIVHVVRMYEVDGSNADLCRRAAVEAGARIAVPGSEGAELAPELLPDAGATLEPAKLLAGGVQPLGPEEAVVFKPRWGAFFGTPLEAHLRAREVSTLVFCGCNFPNCPRTSIYEASERDFRVVVARDAVSGLYERGEGELERIGVTLMDAAELEGSLAAAGAPAR